MLGNQTPLSLPKMTCLKEIEAVYSCAIHMLKVVITFKFKHLI